MEGCSNCQELQKMLDQALHELEEARERSARATDLMMKGEALRDRMMLESIVGSDIDEKKSKLVYLVTGKRIT